MESMKKKKAYLRELNSAFISKNLQTQLKLETIRHSQLSRTLKKIQPKVLYDIFGQLLKQVQLERPTTKRNSDALIDSSPFHLVKNRINGRLFVKLSQA